MVPASMVPLRRSAYALPVTPQMLLMAAQRLHDGTGATADLYVRYIANNFPLVLRDRALLEEDVRRKLALCVDAGVLEHAPPHTSLPAAAAPTAARATDCPRPCTFRPACALQAGRLDRGRVRLFWDAATAHAATHVCPCPCACAKRGGRCTRRRGGAWRLKAYPWMRRVLRAAHNALRSLEEELTPEDEQGTQTDSRVTDWVDPRIADADYLY